MNFKLRNWQENDLNDLVHFANNPNIAKNLTDQFPYPYTKENGKKFIEMATSQNPKHVKCIEVNGRAAGGIGIHAQSGIFSRNAEIGYWLAEDYWGNGIMTKAIAEMVPYGFKNWDIDRIYGRVFTYNPASAHLLIKNGFKLESHIPNAIVKNGVVMDDMVYGKRRE